ncbi:hypothetical protein SPONN_201 [uncultured Candidatus Thioglobus sp.]|nr:hypothetical protein SPONN_201 [uncultured Candidatus Thioglobus sp.]
MKNPSTNPAPKQKRTPNIKDSDYPLLFAAASDRLKVILTIAKLTGARSSEFESIRPLEDKKFFISGTKETATRGRGRTIQLYDETEASQLRSAIHTFHAHLQNTNLKDYIGALRKELDKTSKSIWPRRKPVTYSTFRHQN